ncbi:class II histone deacetylase, partial [Burkholderia pseudomallei]
RSGVHPRDGRQLTSASYRYRTHARKRAAQRHCGGRLVIVHEGGYSEAYVPFCGHAIVEALAGMRTDVADPMLELAIAQQPGERFNAFQRQLIDEMATSFGY